MRIFIMAAAAGFATLLMSGCSSFQATQEPMLHQEQLGTAGKSVAHLDAEVNGFYLFNLPILTGSVTKVGGTELFKDTVRVDKVLDMVTAESNKLNANATRDIVTQTSTMPFFFGMRSVTVSANAMQVNQKK